MSDDNAPVPEVPVPATASAPVFVSIVTAAHGEVLRVTETVAQEKIAAGEARLATAQDIAIGGYAPTPEGYR